MPTPETPGFELRLLLAVCHRLPRVRGPGALAMLLKRFYLRRPRSPVLAHILGNLMALAPDDFAQGAMLFFPQLLDAEELKFLRKHVLPGDLVLDVGAHVGFYTLQLSRSVGPSGRVIAIEADPENRAHLIYHLTMNGIENVTVVDQAVADEKTTMRLGRDQSGNTGRHSLLAALDAGVEVQCETLFDILTARAASAERIAAAKIDIEGMEYRVLRRFYAEAPRRMWPHALVVEFYPEWVELAGGDVIELLQERGYRALGQKHANHFFVLRD